MSSRRSLASLAKLSAELDNVGGRLGGARSWMRTLQLTQMVFGIFILLRLGHLILDVLDPLSCRHDGRSVF